MRTVRTASVRVIARIKLDVLFHDGQPQSARMKSIRDEIYREFGLEFLVDRVRPEVAPKNGVHPLEVKHDGT